MSRALALFILLVASSAGHAAPVQWTVAAGGNGHWYDIVTDNLSWREAFADAPTVSWMGQSGYMATVTSNNERLFLDALNSAQTNVWLGASDADDFSSEGSFVWVNGPEAGQLITYSNWVSGEPNNSGTIGEDYLASAWSGGRGGRWNDFIDVFIGGYVIEFDAAPVTAVPLPPAGLLLLSALGGLAVAKRKQLKA